MMRGRALLAVPALVLGVSTSCFDPEFVQPLCDRDGLCPPGWECPTGRAGKECVQTEDAIDAGPQGIDAAAACDPATAFTAIDPVDVQLPDARRPTLSPDEREIVFETGPWDQTAEDLYVATRPSTQVGFGTAVAVELDSRDSAELGPSLSADARRLFYTSPLGGADLDIFLAERTDAGGAFSTARKLGTSINSGTGEARVHAVGDGSTLYFERAGAAWRATGGVDVWTLAEVTWSPPSPTGAYGAPVATRDDLTLYFTARSGGDAAIWRARRAAPSGDFLDPVEVAELRSPDDDEPAWLSPDGCRLYFTRTDGDGRSSIWRASRSP